MTMVGTGDTASTATTAVVRDSANFSSSAASALRRFAAASATNSSSSCGSTPMPAAHRRPTKRRNACSIAASAVPRFPFPEASRGIFVSNRGFGHEGAEISI